MSVFDELARNLAGPMPRKRVLWIAAGALVAVALPGGRATAGSTSGAKAWRTAGCGKDGGGIPCAEQFGPLISECCGPINSSDPDSNYTCCPPGECWHHGSGKNSLTNCCPVAFRCGERCCAEGQRCVDGECMFCPADKVCGKDCCEPSQDCANPKLGLCCVKTWKKCTAGLAGVVKCCPPTDTCCFNKTTNKATCCDKQHPCVDGRCKCTKDETRCGDKCCKKDKEVCSRGKCCAKGLENCGDGRCCDPDQCCGKTCCGKSEFCASSIAHSVAKVCCPRNRLLAYSGKRVCCPKGTIANNTNRVCCPPGDPTCCTDGDDELSCLGNAICVRGTCQTVSSP
jgi:hypothetical protein